RGAQTPRAVAHRGAHRTWARRDPGEPVGRVLRVSRDAREVRRGLMELRILGCHGGETPHHKTSSFLVDGRLAIDAGAVTSMLTLEEQRRIEAVLVSHAHLDHIKDLATLADNRCQQGGPTITISGVPETIAILKKHFF